MKSQNQCVSTQQNAQSRDSRNPQNSISMRKAAAKLKQKQSQIQMIKKRFQVLKGHQQYNRYRTLDQERRIKQHHTMHQSNKSDRMSLQKQLLRQRQKQLKQLKQRHDQIQRENKQKTTGALEDLMTSRLNDRNLLRHQSKINKGIINKYKRENLDQKTRIKETVLSEQKRQRKLVSQFKHSHIRQTLGNRSIEASKLNQLVQTKDKQLQILVAYQQQLLKKASQSIAVNQRLKGQYGKVFVEVKQKNYLKFPSIRRQSVSYRPNQLKLGKNLSIYDL